MKWVAIVHNDFDGTASAAIYARAVNALPTSVLFTEPTRLAKLLKGFELRDAKRIVIADLGINASTFDDILKEVRRLSSQGAEIQWFDHHVWKEEWKKALTEAGVQVYHDTSTCGGGLVHKVMNPDDEVSEVIARADCSVDLWLHDYPLGEKLRRVIENRREFEWKKHVIVKFFNGAVWDEEFERILNDMVNKELKGYNELMKYARVIEVNGVKGVVAVRWKGPPDISYASQYLMARTGAQFYASANGRSISFRSSTIDVRRFAEALGGGGHPLAAGAGLKAPFLKYFLYKLGMRKPMLDWVTDVVEEVVRKTGVVQYQKAKAQS
ncbi:MAG: DHH family phosphoesterase [Thermoprotei archaeon]